MNNSKIIKTLFNKEIRDIFRDRKTVLMMFFVPVVLYPLIFFVAFTVVSYIQMGVGTQEYKVVIDGDDGGRIESELLSYNSSTDINTDVSDVVNDAANNEVPSQSDNSKYVISVLNTDDLYAIADDQQIEYTNDADAVNKIINDEYIDAYIKVVESEKTEYDSYEVTYNSSITNSSNTYDIIRDCVSEIRSQITENELKKSGLDPDEILEPIELVDKDQATTEETFGYFLGTIIPFMMIISLLVSVFTPAIDVTTGEKERGTLETLLLMPVSNTQLITAKFLAVALIGVISTVLSILSMSLLGGYMLTILTENSNISLGGLDISTFVPAIIVAIPVLIVLSLFLTAISMCVSCVARTYKEANTYMSPVMIVVMLVGYIGFIPNIDFNTTIAAIPVVNVCLLIKNILLFKLDIYLVFIVIISTAAYAGIILLLLGKLYRSEAVLFDEDRGSIKLFEKRENIIPGSSPTIGDAWFVVFLDIFILIYAGGILQVKMGLTGIFLSQLLLLVLPIAMIMYTKRYPRDTFSLYVPGRSHLKNAREDSPIKVIASGLVMGIGGILISFTLSNVMVNVFPDIGSAVSDSIGSYMEGAPILVWLVIAVTPAVCEELVFRGYLLAAFRERYSVLLTSILVGVIFGIYHTDIVRFPGTAFMGITFAYITIRTGSIFIGMFLHMLNNSIAVFSYLFPDWIETHMKFLADETPTVSTLLIAAGIGIILWGVGFTILRNGRENEL